MFWNASKECEIYHETVTSIVTVILGGEDFDFWNDFCMILSVICWTSYVLETTFDCHVVYS